jgi:hypothetical protein
MLGDAGRPNPILEITGVKPRAPKPLFSGKRAMLWPRIGTITRPRNNGKHARISRATIVAPQPLAANGLVTIARMLVVMAVTKSTSFTVEGFVSLADRAQATLTRRKSLTRFLEGFAALARNAASG